MSALRSLLLLVALATAPVGADAESRLFLAGGEVADAAYYGYAGLVLPLPGHADGRGFLQRYWLDRFGYEYDGGVGRVKANALGAEAALGYGASSARGWATGWIGLRYTDTSLSPDDREASARGRQLGAKLQLEGERSVAEAWRIGAIGSWSNEQDAYWGRVRVMRAVSTTRAVGVEFVANGNQEADSTAAGLVLELRPADRRWSVGLKAGYRFQDDVDGVYGGVELGYGF